MYARYIELRNSLGIRDSDVSKATNIPASTFTDWKTGKSKPGAEKLFKLSKFFNVPMETFIAKGGD